MRPLTFRVLRLLADGRFRSGAGMAEALGVSRASVWHALNEAEVAGVAVHRVHGRGYRLAEPLDWLDAGRLADALAGQGLQVDVVERCESTNTALLERARAGARSGTVLVAELQTRGRGRLGRTWESGLARALTFSLLWRFERGAAALAGLSLAMGLAIARALRARGAPVELKWPNDLLWQGRKLGGILIEVQGDVLGPSAAVIGVGINVRLGGDRLAAIGQPAADLVDAAGRDLARTDVLTEVLRAMADAAAAFAEGGFARFRSAWTELHAHQGRAVSVNLPDGSASRGIARGVDEQGALLVECDGRVQRFLSGDISLRAAA